MRGKRRGGVHGEKGGHAWQKGGMCGEGAVHGEGGMRGMHTPSLRDTAGQCAGGAHPTGMHSCISLFVLLTFMNETLL